MFANAIKYISNQNVKTIQNNSVKLLPDTKKKRNIDMLHFKDKYLPRDSKK